MRGLVEANPAIIGREVFAALDADFEAMLMIADRAVMEDSEPLNPTLTMHLAAAGVPVDAGVRARDVQAVRQAGRPQQGRRLHHAHRRQPAAYRGPHPVEASPPVGRDVPDPALTVRRQQATPTAEAVVARAAIPTTTAVPDGSWPAAVSAQGSPNRAVTSAPARRNPAGPAASPGTGRRPGPDAGRAVRVVAAVRGPIRRDDADYRRALQAMPSLLRSRSAKSPNWER